MHTKAFERFAGAFYSTEDVNFSESAMAKAKLRTKASQRTEFVSRGRQQQQQHFESPVDRYTRLKDEVQRFKEDLQTYASEVRATLRVYQVLVTHPPLRRTHHPHTSSCTHSLTHRILSG